jgi:hypothetical protein
MSAYDPQQKFRDFAGQNYTHATLAPVIHPKSGGLGLPSKQQPEDDHVRYQQSRDDNCRDEIGRPQIAIGRLTEALKHGIEQIERPYDVENPDQGQGDGPVEPQGQQGNERQNGRQQIPIGGGLGKRCTVCRETGEKGSALPCGPSEPVEVRHTISP